MGAGAVKRHGGCAARRRIGYDNIAGDGSRSSIDGANGRNGQTAVDIGRAGDRQNGGADNGINHQIIERHIAGINRHTALGHRGSAVVSGGVHRAGGEGEVVAERNIAFEINFLAA